MNKLKQVLVGAGFVGMSIMMSGCFNRLERESIASGREVLGELVTAECFELGCTQPTQCLSDANELFTETRDSLRQMDSRGNGSMTLNDQDSITNRALVATLREVTNNRCEITGLFIPRSVEDLQNGY